MNKHLQSKHFVYCCSNNKYVVLIIGVILVFMGVNKKLFKCFNI